MFPGDDYAIPQSALGWRSEIVARLQDFFARKGCQVSDGWSAFLKAAEKAVSPAQLRGQLRGLLAKWRGRDAAEVSDVSETDRELAVFIEEIRCYLREVESRRTIENYGAYIFTVDIEL